MKLDRSFFGASAERGQQRQALIDDVRAARRRRDVPVREDGVEGLLAESRREPDAERRARCARERAALDVSLEVQHHVEAGVAKPPAYGADLARDPRQVAGAARCAPGVHIDDDEIVERRMATQDRRLPLLHHPRDPGRRNELPQRGGHRQGVDDIAERRQLHDPDIHDAPGGRPTNRSAIAWIKSRLE